MTFSEHDRVILTEDIPNHRLRSGDVGAVVHIHNKGEAFEVEFTTLTGQTVAVTTVKPSQVRAVTRRDVNHVREIEVSPA
jgi:hypothetical protein